MPDGNPFRITNESNDSDKDVGQLCPYMGFVVVPVPKAKGLLRPGEPPIDMQSVMQPCQRDRCMMWDSVAEDCGNNVQRELMKEIRDGLAPLQKMFGGR